MRTPFIAGNWKMNTNLKEAKNLASDLLSLDSVEGVDKVLCPPFISLSLIKDIVKGSTLKLGAQNMHFEEKGAYTGEISPLMLVNLCEYVILGHSERREYFFETDEMVNNKVHAAINASLKPIVCVGEKLTDKDNGLTAEVITRQVKGAFSEVASPNNIVIAYEPIWAIGTGRAASSKQANDTIGLIRSVIGLLYDTTIAQSIRILYGGSVTSENIYDFISQKEIDGALVGGASLKSEEFISIVKQSAKV